MVAEALHNRNTMWKHNTGRVAGVVCRADFRGTVWNKEDQESRD